MNDNSINNFSVTLNNEQNRVKNEDNTRSWDSVNALRSRDI